MSAAPTNLLARVARVACVGCDPPTVALVRETVAVGLPGAQVEEQATATQIPAADCVVLQDAPGADLVLRALRAGGYGGAVAVVVDDDAGRGVDATSMTASAAAARFGVQAVVPRARIARELPAAVAAAVGTLDASGRPHPAWTALRRVEHLVAAGEVALGLRHALNNPLTGLLAEAQLLEMEPRLSAEHREAVRRIVTLCRRTIAVTRGLDAIAAPRRADAANGPDVGAA